MEREKELEIVNALQGLTKAEWELVKKDVEVAFEYSKIDTDVLQGVLGVKRESHPSK